MRSLIPEFREVVIRFKQRAKMDPVFSGAKFDKNGQLLMSSVEECALRFAFRTPYLELRAINGPDTFFGLEGMCKNVVRAFKVFKVLVGAADAATEAAALEAFLEVCPEARDPAPTAVSAPASSALYESAIVPGLSADAVDGQVLPGAILPDHGGGGGC